MKIIKMIGKKNYVLSLYQDDLDGQYLLVYETEDKMWKSNKIQDLMTAKEVFDLLEVDSEGN